MTRMTNFATCSFKLSNVQASEFKKCCTSEILHPWTTFWGTLRLPIVFIKYLVMVRELRYLSHFHAAVEWRRYFQGFTHFSWPKRPFICIMATVISGKYKKDWIAELLSLKCDICLYHIVSCSGKGVAKAKAKTILLDADCLPSRPDHRTLPWSNA